MKTKLTTKAKEILNKISEKGKLEPPEAIEIRKSPPEIVIRDNRLIIALLSIISVIAIGFVLYQIRSIILPFALAVFISYVLNPVIQFFENRKIPTFFAILFALIITFLVLNLCGILIFTSIKSFASEFPKYSAGITALIQNALDFLGIPNEAFKGAAGGGERSQLLDSIRDLSLHKLILNTLGSMLNFMSNTLLVLLFLLFILIGRNQLVLKVQHAFQEDTALRIADMLKNINRQIQRYLIAKGFISLATGFLYFIVLYSFKVEFAIIWGILAFLLNFIPTIGSVIATILPLLIAFIQFGNFADLLWLALILVTIQVTIGNFIDPRVVGQRLNLSPLVVLFSLMFWGWLWGIIGMFLAVPISVIIKIIFENTTSLQFISVLMSHTSKK
jgi:predicted PurR-regulated permease PerM